VSTSAERDQAGRRKIDALKCALTGLGCAGDGFLGGNFTPDDRIGMTSFGVRWCGKADGSEFTGNVCEPDNKLLLDHISSAAAAINRLGPGGPTNTREGLRTGKTEIANAFADTSRSATRKVVLLVTDGQPTALRLDSITACERDPLDNNTPLGGPSWTDGTGCISVKRGNSSSPSVSDGLSRLKVNTEPEEEFVFPVPGPSAPKHGHTVSGSGRPNALYLNQMKKVRNAAREEARQIRELGGGNAVIFAKCSP
jgi:hypothetical protein